MLSAKHNMCVCTPIHTHVHVHTHTCMYACTCASIYTCCVKPYTQLGSLSSLAAAARRVQLKPHFDVVDTSGGRCLCSRALEGLVSLRV